MVIILGIGTIVSAPAVYGLIHKGKLADNIHRTLLGTSAVVGLLLLLMLTLYDTPTSIVLSFVIWRGVNASLLMYSWKEDRISPALYMTEMVLGFIVLWRLMVFLVPVMYPGIAYTTALVGSFTIAAGTTGALLSRKIKISMSLRRSLKVLYFVILGVLLVKVTWVITSVLVLQAEDVTGNIQLVRYLLTYAPVPFIAGGVFGGLLPMVLTAIILSEKLLNSLKSLSTAVAISLIVGELFLKYLAVQYGFSL